MARVVVVGGGAGGMLAAGRAAESGAKVVLLERNSVLGKKLRITGKGRGNVTNTAGIEEFVAAFGPTGKFLYGAFSRFSNNDLIEVLDRLGVPTKVERGGRVFPKSDRASDVADALDRRLRELRVDIRLGTRAKGLSVSGDPVTSIAGVNVFGGTMSADAVIIATGGITYPATGSTGDGYRMAAEVGHTIVPPVPSLAALDVAEGYVSNLEGLSLRNVEASLHANGKRLGREPGEMLFTGTGVSGPIILTLSKVYARLEDKSDVELRINLKPGLDREKLEARLLADFTRTTQYMNYLGELLPRKMVPVFAEVSRISGDTTLNKITSVQRRRIIDMLLGYRFTITGARPAEEAIVTAGGVAIGEIDSRTMESKIVQGLYLCGEVIDIDGTTGGYNLQAAFSTGWVAGENAARDRNAPEGQAVR